MASPFAYPKEPAGFGMRWEWDGTEWRQVPATGPLEFDQKTDDFEAGKPLPTGPIDPLGGGGDYGKPFPTGPLIPTGPKGEPMPKGGWGGGGGGWEWPEFLPPTYKPPKDFEGLPQFSFPQFDYEKFAAPDYTAIQNDPGYQFGLKEGRRTLENAASARGTARTGGALKDILEWGQGFAAQHVGDVYRRQADTYDRNRANAFGNWAANRENAADAYSMNYGVARDVWDRNTGLSKDVFDRNYRGASDAFNAKFRGAELSFDDLYRRWALGQDDAYKRWRDQLEAQLRLATMQLPD